MLAVRGDVVHSLFRFFLPFYRSTLTPRSACSAFLRCDAGCGPSFVRCLSRVALCCAFRRCALPPILWPARRLVVLVSVSLLVTPAFGVPPLTITFMILETRLHPALPCCFLTRLIMHLPTLPTLACATSRLIRLFLLLLLRHTCPYYLPVYPCATSFSLPSPHPLSRSHHVSDIVISLWGCTYASSPSLLNPLLVIAILVSHPRASSILHPPPSSSSSSFSARALSLA